VGSDGPDRINLSRESSSSSSLDKMTIGFDERTDCRGLGINSWVKSTTSRRAAGAAAAVVGNGADGIEGDGFFVIFLDDLVIGETGGDNIAPLRFWTGEVERKEEESRVTETDGEGDGT